LVLTRKVMSLAVCKKGKLNCKCRLSGQLCVPNHGS
jgi:hypothetical protein